MGDWAADSAEMDGRAARCRWQVARDALRHSGGFTLIEMMAALAVLAILISVAAPSIREFIMNGRIRAQASDLAGDLALARSEAVKRNVRVALCTSNNGTSCTESAWQAGWIVFADPDADGALASPETVIKAASALSGGNVLSTTGQGTNSAGGYYVEYRPSGVVNAAGAADVVFTLCDSRTTADRGRTITVSITGRVETKPVTCS